MCHLFPEPSLLDTATWKNHVLPNMGWRLGIRKSGDDPYRDMEPDEATLVKSQNVYPNSPLIPKENWQKIVAYYLQHAPAQPLPQKDTLSFENELTGFHPQAVFFDERQFPKTCLLKFDSAKSLLYVGDADRSLYAINGNLQLVSLHKTPSPPVDIDFSKPDSGSVLCIGSISPSDKKNGLFYSLDSTDAAQSFEGLARPVCVEEADLNGDGKKDLLICQFGNHSGKLSWFDGGDPKKEHVLKLQPGARKVEVRDMNGDGKPDIVALMAQAKEELVMFINKGKGVFSEQSIYKFPPVYGVSYFELVDFNQDGHPDILLTNGDNWDLSPIRKNFPHTDERWQEPF